MPFFNKLKLIVRQLDYNLWLSICLIITGALLSFYYGSNLEKAMSFALNDQSVILRTLNDIEKFEIRIKNHFYLGDKNRENLNLEEIKNLRIEIDYLLKSLAEKEKYPRIKLLKRRWEKEVSTISEILNVIDKEHIDFRNLESFLYSFKELSQETLANNQETKSFEVVKLKLLRIFTISIITFAFFLILRKLVYFKLEADMMNIYFDETIKGLPRTKMFLNHRSMYSLKKKIDQQNENFLLLKDQCDDYLNIIKETFIVCRPDFTITKCSKEIRELVGWESFELENKKLSFLFERKEDFEDLELKYYQNGKKLFNIPLRCQTSTGVLVNVQGTFVDYYDKILHKNIILIILKDGTAEMKVEELTEKSKHLFHNSKMASLGEMSGSIAHEINNPLMIIKGSVSRLSKVLLREGNYSEPVEILLDRLNRMIERVSSIIYVMQSFGDSGDRTEKEFVLVKDLIVTLLELHAQKLRSKGIRIDFSLSNPDIQVKINKSDIDQALMNIFTNAVEGITQSGADSGNISLRVVFEKEQLYMLIRNDGAPIEKHLASKIFEPFFSSKDKGTGMGLAIAHTLCQRNEVDLRLDCLYPVTFRLEFYGATKV